jgi:hypothetical protein
MPGRVPDAALPGAGRLILDRLAGAVEPHADDAAVAVRVVAELGAERDPDMSAGDGRRGGAQPAGRAAVSMNRVAAKPPGEVELPSRYDGSVISSRDPANRAASSLERACEY